MPPEIPFKALAKCLWINALEGVGKMLVGRWVIAFGLFVSS